MTLYWFYDYLRGWTFIINVPRINCYVWSMLTFYVSELHVQVKQFVYWLNCLSVELFLFVSWLMFSRFTICSCQPEKLKTRRFNLQAAGAAVSVLRTTRRQVPGILLDRVVFGGPQHTVCGCSALRPAWTTFRFSMWVGGNTSSLYVQIIPANTQMLPSQLYRKEVGVFSVIWLNPWKSWHRHQQTCTSRRNQELHIWMFEVEWEVYQISMHLFN